MEDTTPYDEQYWQRHEMMGKSWKNMSKMLRATIAADLIESTKLYNIVVPADQRLPFADD